MQQAGHGVMRFNSSTETYALLLNVRGEGRMQSLAITRDTLLLNRFSNHVSHSELGAKKTCGAMVFGRLLCSELSRLLTKICHRHLV